MRSPTFRSPPSTVVTLPPAEVRTEFAVFIRWSPIRCPPGSSPVVLLAGSALGLGHECDGLGPSPQRGPEFLMHKYILLSPIPQSGPASM
jgi:hypothetical protein